MICTKNASRAMSDIALYATTFRHRDARLRAATQWPSAKEGLLALAVSTGLQVMTAMSEEDVTRLCGPGGKHNPDRAGYRHGAESGSVTLGGRRVPVTRPRVRAADGTGELHLPGDELF